MPGFEAVTTEDLIRVLDMKALDYFNGPELGRHLPPPDDPRNGIFVRLGRVIILGSAVKHGPKIVGRSLSLNHVYLMSRGLNEMGIDVTDRIMQTAPRDEGNYLNGQWPVLDAGKSRIDTFDGRPHGLVLFGRSTAFGDSSKDARQETGAVAKRILGLNIEVDALY